VTELDRIQFIFNADCVGGNPPIGLALQDCPELEPAFTELSRGLEADVSVQNHLVPFSDQFPFTLQGLPSAFIATMGADRRGWGHTAADTLDKVNLPGVRLAATVIGRLVLRVANDIVPWPGRRRTVDEVKSALQAAGIEPLLRAQQVWP
jgi:Zn-dependent M28 family amino/carboxypeptidase